MTPRIAAGPARRAGITLTEILISILIMGVGMISLATLFPIGLVRLRNAARDTRSGLYYNTVSSEMQVRNLLTENSFTATWYNSNTGLNYLPMRDDPIDPSKLLKTGGLSWSGSPLNPNRNVVSHTAPPVAADTTAYFDYGPGIPFCYDPLWRMQTATPPTDGTTVYEARFGNGEGVVRTDPDGNPPSAHGLQRVTNLPVETLWGTASAQTGTTLYYEWKKLVGDLCASQDDQVLQAFAANPMPSQGKGSPLVADLSNGSPMNDWTFTWLFTGHQVDVNEPGRFEGDVVVFQNRPFGFDPLLSAPFKNAYTPTNVASGETVVEAVWGYAQPIPLTNGANYGFDPSPNSRTVLLRWPATQPDPDVRAGGWIADVTYERVGATTVSRFGSTALGQRCIWYRVAKKTAADLESGPTNNQFNTQGTPYRRMVVTLDSSLRSKSLLRVGASVITPVNVNAALICPSVVYTFPQSFTAR